ncbi:MAG: helicase/relaxase domain-containing protein [Methylococcales bacterium]|nr:helicase/relaxase domain-containing protein [Methylococcales bacterium]
MFKQWFKGREQQNTETIKYLKPPKVPGIIHVKSIDELLSAHKGRLTQINELAGLSKVNFDCFYLSAIHQYARFVQQCPASEVHHHAGLGGMLTHALEVCVIALKIRRSYLLSETGGAEEISQKQDLWTYAVFIAALCHDLAKVAVDQVLTIYDEKHQQQKWEPWEQFIDEQGQWYTSEFVHNRQYKLHEKASPLLISRIISSQGMKWISSDQTIFSHWLACLSGDIDNAASIGEIISIADSKSVAANLGADNSRMPTVKTKPLHEKMLTALRYLLMEGELPLNRNGAAGWIKGDDCWLVSKRTVDAIREQLIQEGHSGIPTKNGRLFDVLQEHGVIIPYGDKAIWSVTVEGDGWSNDLTLIKMATSKIWVNLAQRPNNFEGRIVTKDVKLSENKPQEKTASQIKIESTKNVTESSAGSSSLEKIEYKALEPLEQNFTVTEGDESDLLAFLPSISPDSKDNITLSVAGEIEVKKNEENEPRLSTQSEPTIPSKESLKKQVTLSTHNDVGTNADQVSLFFKWLQDGVQAGSLKANQAKARIHIVNEGVILITPGIFQDFAKSQCNKDTSSWSSIQQKVLKKNWHVRDAKGLNVVKYTVKGVNKKAVINAVLFEDVSKVFGVKEPPTSNPHLTRIS